MLLKRQRNEFFSLLQKAGLNPQDFKEEAYEAHYVLRFTGGDYFFSIGEGDSYDFDIDMQPGIDKPRTEESIDKWPSAMNYFAYWAKALHEEIEAPDLWAEAATTAQLFGSSAAPNEKFTDHELRELQSQLRAVEAKLTASGLPEAAIRELTAALRDAAPKAESMSKKDWQNMVVGAVVGNLTTLALSAEHVQAVYQILKATFSGWLLH